MLSNLWFIAPGYPTKTDAYYTFVEQLCHALAKKQVKVTVIAPQSISHAILHHKEIHPRYRIDIVDNFELHIYQPYYITLPYKFKKINNFLFTHSVRRIVKNLEKPDVVYAHFWQTGYCAYEVVRKLGFPLFVATGESQIEKMFDFNIDINSFANYVKGVIAVSTHNKTISEKLGLALDNTIVLPNAINSSAFYKKDRVKCRRNLNIKEDLFVVAFVGWFIDRKGPLRLCEAIRRTTGVYSFFIGSGEQEPDCDNILFKGRVSHEIIADYLNAADVFVLPTKNEGCCNAVIEAMACGLPVVSSDLPFNWDVLNESNSILIDPDDIDALSNAIVKLRNNVELRSRLAQGALATAEKLTISERASKIFEFIETSLEKNNKNE